MRTAQLDGPLCEAIDAWQLAHGIRSTSAAMRLLLERALVEDGTVELGERLTLARASALRAAREAMGAALDRLADGE